MGEVVLDTSVVVAARERNDCHHVAARDALRAARANQTNLVLPASVLAECLVRPLADGTSDDVALDELVSVFFVEPLTEDIALEAAKLRVATKLRLPDALVVATGVHLDADQILTCDKAWKGVDKRVRVLACQRPR